MKNISCCFTGHRDIPYYAIGEINKRLDETLEMLINDGYREFYAGGAIGFDTVAAEAVIRLKEKYPDIHLHIIMPCKNQTARWSEENILRHNAVNEKADEVKCLSEVYFNGCMQVRNHYMADRSSVVVAYLTRLSGGSAGTVSYAEKNGVKVINIAD